MNEHVFVDGNFTAPRARRDRITAVLLEHMPDDHEIRILDLGCGNGLQLMDLAEAFGHAHLTGVDTSGVNISSARQRIAKSPHAHRMELHEGDYLSMNTEPFDVILSDSVLQNIPVPDAVLYGKLARDLRAGGLLIASIPYACGYNRALWWVRRLLRVFRAPFIERVALRIARYLHPSWDPKLLMERIPYMYMLPARIDDDSMVDTLEQGYALKRVAVFPVAHASPAQAKHRLSVFRKAAAK